MARTELPHRAPPSLELARGVIRACAQGLRVDPEETLRRALDLLRGRGLVSAGDPVVVVSDVLLPGFDDAAVLLRHA